jgi:hypothetical protein
MADKKRVANHVVRKGDLLVKVTHKEYVLHLLRAAQLYHHKFGTRWTKETMEKASLVCRQTEAECETCNPTGGVN